MPPEIDITDYFDTIRNFVEDIESKEIPTEKIDENASRANYFDEALRDTFRKNKDINPGGSSGKGIDLPRMNTDIKAPITKQSSSPATNPGEEILGVDHNILLFNINLTEIGDGKSKIEVEQVKFIPKEMTADHDLYEEAKRLVERYDNGDITEEKLIDCLHEITATGEYIDIPEDMIEEIKQGNFEQGVIKHSNAIQFRFQYDVAFSKYSDITENII